MLKWLIRSAALLAMVLALLYVRGRSLPEAHMASSAARFAQRPEAVWALMTDLERRPGWNGTVKRVEVLDDQGGLLRWLEESSFGTFEYQTLEKDPPRRRVVRVHDPEGSFGGTWSYEIASLEDGMASRLSITEQGEVYAPIMRAISHDFMDPNATMDAELRAMGAQFGEEVVPEHLPVADQ
jgi:uncharacterized protein YndB with AHSA1/START domain